MRDELKVPAQINDPRVPVEMILDAEAEGNEAMVDALHRAAMRFGVRPAAAPPPSGTAP